MYAHVVKLFVNNITVIKIIIIIINNDKNVDNGYKIYEATSTHARTHVRMYVYMYVSLMYVSRYVIKNINVFINCYYTTSRPRVHQSHALKTIIH